MRSLFGLEFVHLLNMDSKATSSVQATRTHAAFEVFRLLVLHKN